MTEKIQKKMLPDKLSPMAPVQPQSCAVGAGGLLTLYSWDIFHNPLRKRSLQKGLPILQTLMYCTNYYVDFMDYLYKLQ